MQPLTSSEHPVSCIEPGLAICFTYDNIHVLMLFSQIIPPLPSPTPKSPPTRRVPSRGTPRVLAPLPLSPFSPPHHDRRVESPAYSGRRPWGFSPEARRGSQGAYRAAPGKSGLHVRGKGERVLALESREGTRASRRVKEEGNGMGERIASKHVYYHM